MCLSLETEGKLLLYKKKKLISNLQKLKEYKKLFPYHFKMSYQRDAISAANVIIYLLQKEILLHNQKAAIKIRELTLIQCYFFI